MSESVSAHRAASRGSLHVAVATVSDTRTLETDKSGARLIELLEGAGHKVEDRVIIADEPNEIRALLRNWGRQQDLHAALFTGGTGISARDQTFEVISGLLTKALPGYGELFRMLSYQEIGAAAMLSRAVGGLIDRLVVLTMPGSTKAVELAMTRLVLPELPHLVSEARKDR